MKKKLILCLITLLACIGASASVPVSGVVKNERGNGVPGVKVTDGFSIVKTDADGKYKLTAHDNAEFVYLCMPDGYAVPVRNGAPCFYAPINKNDQKQKINFTISRTGRPQGKHMFICWADAQVYEEHEVSDYITLAAEDVKSVVEHSGVPAFGMNCGDIEGDQGSGLSLKTQELAGSTGIPFFALMGNHDYKWTNTNESSKKPYKDLFGPTYYSFDFGKIHYIVMDDVFHFGRHYMGYIEESQLEWIKEDLSYVPEGSTVVLFCHIPTYSREARNGKPEKEYNKIVVNRGALYDILKPYTAHICSAHEHYAENYQIKDNIFEHVQGPLSGVFWQSLLSCDGIPWGYYVYEVDGSNISWYYKAVGLDKSSQFTAYAVGEDPHFKDDIVANVWNWDPAWKVEWFEDGVLQGEMTKFTGWDRAIVDDVEYRRDKEFKWKYVGAGSTEHMFRATPSRSDADVAIKVTDRFGNVYEWKNSGSILGVSETKLTNVEAPADYATFTGTCKAETDLYNLALAELKKDVEEDGTFRTGELWGGVWTRDISYSIILGAADYELEVAKNSLMRKVDRLGRIIQDTGTGGSWPCSTDRLVWAAAAWEVYLRSGEKEWIQTVYPIIKKSLESDLKASYDDQTGLFMGESSFIDWRVQSYPAWMQPADIAQSECLGTNAVFYRVLDVTSQMASILGDTDTAEIFSARAQSLKDAINKNLWMPEKGWYSQYLYGRDHKLASPRSETLGESLCVVWGIANDEQAASIFSDMPVSEWGPTIFWPQIQSQGAYHNNGIWPFVTSFYGLAGAMAKNEKAVAHAVWSNLRMAAEYGTYYENMVSNTGENNTILNSPRQLWSVSGMIGLYNKLAFGMEFCTDGLRFKPFVPQSMKGLRCLKNFKYRDMTLDITVHGVGSKIEAFKVDGSLQKEAFISASLEGTHSIDIWLRMEDWYAPGAEINVQPYTCAPEYTTLTCKADTLVWNSVPGASEYKLIHNGQEFYTTRDTCYVFSDSGEYSVIAVDAQGVQGFISEPLRVSEDAEYPCEVRLSANGTKSCSVTFSIGKGGYYILDWNYSNGNGTIDTYNKCATRSMYVDQNFCGAVVLPQRGDDWNDSGWSTKKTVYLTEGTHTVSLLYEPEVMNMNIDIDEAHIHSLRVSSID